MKKNILLLTLSALLLAGCFGGETKRESITKGWSPKTFFEEAREETNSGTTEKGIALYKQLQAAYPSSKYALQAKLEVAYALYKDEEYDDAIRHLNDFIKLYPRHTATPYAYFLRGVISQSKSSSILDEYVTDNAQRDVGSVRDALQYYLALIEQFPASEYAQEAQTRLIILRNVLARHELFVAIYYTKKGANIAAINRTKFIIEKYPNTPSVPAALHLMAHNYELIKLPLLAQDAKRVLEKSYPRYTPHYSLKK